jgi:hypothetical protein
MEGTCWKHENACNDAHGEDDLRRLGEPIAKLCFNYQRGNCRRPEMCQYYHARVVKNEALNAEVEHYYWEDIKVPIRGVPQVKEQPITIN